MATKRIKDLATTITSFRTGDVIPVDGPSGTAKMSKDDLLKETAENALGSIHSLSDTATNADLVNENYIPLDGGAGTKRLRCSVFSLVIDRGSASVATINALTFLHNGWKFSVTDSGTITLGGLQVCAGDEIIWDTANHTWILMPYISGVDSYFIEFEQGNFDIGGNEIASTTRLRTKNFIEGNHEIRIPYGFLIAAILYYDEDTLQFDSIVNGVFNQHAIIGKAGCVARFTIKKTDGSANITPEEVNGCNDRFALKKELLYLDPKPCSTALLELGNLTASGSNNLYLDNEIFSYKRSKNFFRLKKGDSIPFDCAMYGYDEDFSFVGKIWYKANDPIKDEYAWLKIVISDSNVSNDDAVMWEQGRLSAGQPVPSNTYVRTDFLDFSVFKDYYIKAFSDKMVFAIYGYDSTKTFITGRVYGYTPVTFNATLSIGSFMEDHDNVAYVKIVFHFNPDRDLTPDEAYEICSIGELTQNPDFDSVNSIDVLENVKNTANGNATIKFSYPLYYSKGRSLLNPNVDSSQYDSTVYRNSGLLRLPYNYTQKGEPCPLIIFCHPSDQLLTLNGASDFYAIYSTFWDYLQKEGFAVMDCYTMSSKYPNYTWDWGQPIAGACYEQAYKWVCDNYNIDQNRVFVSAKSQGGLRALLMALGYSSIPVKACGPLAPLLGACPLFGYDKTDFGVIADDCCFEGVMPDISAYTSGDFNYATMPQELKDYIDANKDKLVGVNAFMTNCLSTNAVELFDFLKVYGYSDPDFLAVRRINNVPIKIWNASDDVATPFARAYAFIKQLQNCGSNAELREMPAGTGGHGAVSYDENSIRVSSLTTRLGYTCTDIPLAMVEMVNWFMKYGG